MERVSRRLDKKYIFFFCIFQIVGNFFFGTALPYGIAFETPLMLRERSAHKRNYIILLQNDASCTHTMPRQNLITFWQPLQANDHF